MKYKRRGGAAWFGMKRRGRRLRHVFWKRVCESYVSRGGVEASQVDCSSGSERSEALTLSPLKLSPGNDGGAALDARWVEEAENGGKPGGGDEERVDAMLRYPEGAAWVRLVRQALGAAAFAWSDGNMRANWLLPSKELSLSLIRAFGSRVRNPEVFQPWAKEVAVAAISVAVKYHTNRFPGLKRLARLLIPVVDGEVLERVRGMELQILNTLGWGIAQVPTVTGRLQKVSGVQDQLLLYGVACAMLVDGDVTCQQLLQRDDGALALACYDVGLSAIGRAGGAVGGLPTVDEVGVRMGLERGKLHARLCGHFGPKFGWTGEHVMGQAEDESG